VRIRHSALTSIAAGICMVAAVLCLGQLGASLLHVKGPLAAALDGLRGDVRLAEAGRDRTTAVAARPAPKVVVDGPRAARRRAGARRDRTAAPRRRPAGTRHHTVRRGSARVGGRGRTSQPVTRPQPAQSTPVPTETTDSSATIVATAGEGQTSASGTRSASGTTGSTRRSLLSVASVSVAGGNASGSLLPGSELRVQLAVSDPVATPSTMDLRMKLDAHEIEMLTAKAASAATPATAPLALRARLDVVDAADSAPEGELRVRLQLAPAPADTTASSVDAGDAGGRSNAVDVWAPIELPAGDPSPAPRPDECERTPGENGATAPDEQSDASEAPASEPATDAIPTPDATPAPAPAAVEGEPIEVRLPLTPTETTEPATEAVTVPLPADQAGEATPAQAKPAATGVSVSMEMTVEPVPADAPPADTGTPAAETPATAEPTPAP
jgi:hypothetical protein